MVILLKNWKKDYDLTGDQIDNLINLQTKITRLDCLKKYIYEKKIVISYYYNSHYNDLYSFILQIFYCTQIPNIQAILTLE
jgi:hypothetical protein